MPSLRLTKTALDGIPTPAKQTYYYDSDLKGFFVRVMPSGHKTWGIDYRAGSGRGAEKKRLTLGDVRKLTAEEARRAAKAHLARIALGGDPAAEKAAASREMTVTALIDLYAAEGCYLQRGTRQGEAMKVKTKRYTVAMLRNHVVPVLGGVRLSKLGVADVERFYRDVAVGKTASNRKAGPRSRIIVTGGEGAARKAFRTFSAVLSFAENRGYIERNPCKVAKVRKTDNTCERFLLPEETGRFVAALERVQGSGVNIKAIDIINLWLVTGCRRDEIAGLEWSEVQLGDAPALLLEKSKTGKSWRPCAPAAAAILGSIEQTESPYVFPAERGEGHYQGAKTVWAKVVKEAGLAGQDVTPHTLRHTMGANGVSAGLSLLHVGAILGHANPRSTQRYAHVARDPAQVAAAAATAGLLGQAEAYVARKLAVGSPPT